MWNMEDLTPVSHASNTWIAWGRRHATAQRKRSGSSAAGTSIAAISVSGSAG